MRDAPRTARWLVRCYPRVWRARYGEEFLQLLIDDMSDRPHSLSRTADVIRGGLLARLTTFGLAGDQPEGPQQIRSGLAGVGLASSVFLVAGIAIWAQLTIGWQWSAPAAPATRVAMFLMCGTAVGLVLLGALAALPLLWTMVRELAAGRGNRLVMPMLMTGTGGAVLIAGSMHFGHGWPGTGGHPWAVRDLVPAVIARFFWAATLWISSYWAHPGALATFPASEVTWMIVSPVATLVMLVGAAWTLRRLPLSARVLRYQSWLGLAAGLVMACFLAGASSWVISGGAAPHGLFRVGVIDSVGVLVMATALIVAFKAAQRALAAHPPGAGG